MSHAAKKLINELSDDYGVVVLALGRMTKNMGDHGDNVREHPIATAALAAAAVGLLGYAVAHERK